MEIYPTIMMILSLFGIFTLLLSIYIFIVVPTKMNAMFRAAIIGNFLTSCFAQIYLSLGIIPSVLLPCCAFYTNGLMSYTGTSTFGQIIILYALYATAGFFVVLICLLRALAVLVYLSERRKTQITSAYITFSLTSSLIATVTIHGFETQESGRLSCSKMFNNNPPPELFMSKTLVVSLADDFFMVYLLCAFICFTVIYSTIGFISTGYLISTLKAHRTQSSSSKALESQQKMTLAVLKMVFFQLMGMTVPPLAIMFCILTSVPSGTASEILFILWANNVNIACILMIRLIPAYKERLSKICLSVFPVELIKRITNRKPQTVSVQSSIVPSTSG